MDVPLVFSTKKHFIIYESNERSLDKNGNEIERAHPNIKFKNPKSKDECKHSFFLNDYSIKQRKNVDEKDLIIYSNFDWKEELNRLEFTKKEM